MKKLIIISALLLSCLWVFAQTTTKSYIKTVKARQAIAGDLSSYDTPNETQQSVQYVDGLGRTQQTIVRWGSSDENDLITPTEYDGYGRQAKSYLPYAKVQSSPDFSEEYITEQSNFYDYQGTDGNFAFSEMGFESSPLNRVIEQAAPGADWNISSPNTVSISYGFNDASDNVKKWKHDGLEVSADDFYGPNELYKVRTQDEDDLVSITFTDKQGRTILKRKETGITSTPWADTYYIYDELDRLKVVLPPQSNVEVDDRVSEVEGYQNILGDQNVTTNGDYVYHFGATVTIPAGTNGTTITSGHITPLEVLSPGFLADWAFQYDYDERNRMIMKQVPGADPIYMVYDQWDRLVLTQDGNQRKNNQWIYTTYDELNRPVITGFVTDSRTHSQMQNHIMGLSDPSVSYTGSGTHGYNSNAYPFAAGSGGTLGDILTVTYYDDYAFKQKLNELSSTTEYERPGDFITESDHILPEVSYAVLGQVTGTKVRQVKTSNFIESISFYDNKYRPIQVVSSNHLEGTDIVSNQYDFVGNIRKTQTAHFDGTTTTSIKRRFTYDHMDRLVDTYHQVDDQDEVLIAHNTYNEIGELIQKGLHAENVTEVGVTQDTKFEQEIDYAYNIRGWLRTINNPDLSGSDDLFGMELYYNTNGVTPSNQLFNGNISAIKWSDYNGSANATRAYDYTYDDLNRLEVADHWTNGNKSNSYDVDNISYDLNGNILFLNRRASSNTTYMDDLEYEYEGNQLMWVKDASNNSEGFNDGNTSGADYYYDSNGNMFADANKGITNITYNHLNLPIRVSMGSSYIDYLYDASGVKLQQKVVQGGTTTVTDYIGEFIYQDGDVMQIHHEEGRLVPYTAEGSSAIIGYDYHYNLKDHLGNNRMTFEVLSYESTEDFEGADNGFYNTIQTTSDASLNTTSGGSKIQHLNAGQMGAMTLISLNKGDKIHLSVNARYNSAPASNTFAEVAASSIYSVVNGSPFTGAEGITTGEISDAFNAPTMQGKGNDNSKPQAFLNYIIFDSNMNYDKAGFAGITVGAGIHQNLTINDLQADQAGYILVYITNGNSQAVTVYFDDLTVDHVTKQVGQTQDYYPFGLAFNQYERTASVANNFLYNGKENVKEMGWYDYGFRMLDPAIGRWNAVDPMAETYFDYSPYGYVRNNPIRLVDIMGMADNETLDEWTKKNQEEDEAQKNQDLARAGIAYSALSLESISAKYSGESDGNGDSNGNGDQSSGGNGAIADAAEQYLLQNTMPGNWILNDNTDPAITGGYSFGAKNPAGMCVDCSGLISGSFMAAGFDDPNHGGKGSGILNIESNLTRVNHPQRGDVFTIRNPKGYKYHGGIVTGVQSVVTGYTMDVPIYGTQVTVIHSSSRRGGPVRDTFVVGGSSYYARNLFGFFRN